MAMQFKSIADIQAYIQRHETLMGFPPYAIGLTSEECHVIFAEMENCRRFTADTEGPISEHYVGVTKLVYNSFKQ